MMYGYDYTFLPFLPLITILLLGVIAYAIFIRFFERHYKGNESAEDILSERFAKGEIDEDEYKKRISVLKRHGK